MWARDEANQQGKCTENRRRKKPKRCTNDDLTHPFQSSCSLGLFYSVLFNITCARSSCVYMMTMEVPSSLGPCDVFICKHASEKRRDEHKNQNQWVRPMILSHCNEKIEHAWAFKSIRPHSQHMYSYKWCLAKFCWQQVRRRNEERHPLCSFSWRRKNPAERVKANNKYNNKIAFCLSWSYDSFRFNFRSAFSVTPLWYEWHARQHPLRFVLLFFAILFDSIQPKYNM